MEGRALERMHGGESSWWYRGRKKIIADALRSAFGERQFSSALDFGAGYGAMRELFARFSLRTMGFEPDPAVRPHAQDAGYERVFGTEDEALAQRYDLAGIFDVVEHIEDDVAQLRRIRDALDTGGVLLITVPANQFLWSRHDVENKHFRRYSRTTLTRAVRDAGFDVRSVSYWNTFLFPLAVASRLTGHTGESAFSMPRFIDSFFYALIVCEAFLMRLFPLPFGLSLVLVAVKK